MLRKVITISLVALFALISTTAFASDGAALYKAKCVSCHGADGSGNTPVGKNMKVRDLRSDGVQKQTDIELTKVISGGKGKMPPYGKQLSNTDIAAIIAHIRTLKAK
jgi:cytochrome c6